MLKAYALLSPNNVLQLEAIYQTRERAEASLKAEYPPGHVIWPGYKVVEIRIDVILSEMAR